MAKTVTVICPHCERPHEVSPAGLMLKMVGKKRLAEISRRNGAKSKGRPPLKKP